MMMMAVQKRILPDEYWRLDRIWRRDAFQSAWGSGGEGYQDSRSHKVFIVCLLVPRLCAELPLKRRQSRCAGYGRSRASAKSDASSFGERRVHLEVVTRCYQNHEIP